VKYEDIIKNSEYNLCQKSVHTISEPICQSPITFSKFNAKIITNIEYILLLSIIGQTKSSMNTIVTTYFLEKGFVV